MDGMEIDNESLFLLQNSEKICRLCLDLNQNNQCIFRADNTDPEKANALDLVKKLIVQGGIEVGPFYIIYISFLNRREKFTLSGNSLSRSNIAIRLRSRIHFFG